MKEVLDEANRRAQNYLASLAERAVAPDPKAVAALESLAVPMPDHGRDPAEVLAKLDEIGSPATAATAGPRFFGFVVGGSLPAPLAANWLASAWDQNSAMFEAAPATATFEAVALRWLLDLLGLPEPSAGAFVTGATVANMVALAAARNAVLAAEGWNVEADGLIGAPPVTVLVSDEVHPSVLKSLGLLGLGRERVHHVPVDDQGRMRAEEVPEPNGATIVCTQVGNVNTGACDPVAAICERVRPGGAWVHVDGAFGLWAAASPERRHRVAGMDAADSWATDAHKWLNVPYDSGIAFVRNAQALRSAMAITADYLLLAEDRRNPADYTPEFSRRARGVEVWAALEQLGRSGVAELVDRCCEHARRFAAGLRAAGFEVLNDVVLNQVLVAFGDGPSTHRVIERIQADGTCWCGGTVWQGRTAMRISVSGWPTTSADVDRSLAAILAAANGAANGR